MLRSPVVPLCFLFLCSCGEPAPPVATSILDRVTTTPARVTLGPRTEDVLIAAVPMEFFGNTARPIMGRTFAPEDFGGPAAVCILSYPLWERFGAGTSDAPLVLGDARLQVVGVMPEDFHIPAGANVWIPLIPAPP